MGGLFDEIGPCKINEDYATTELNPNSWNNVSNLLFLSQPVGVGFSYGSKVDLLLSYRGNAAPNGPTARH